MGLWSWVGEASASRTRATEVAPTLAGKVECSFIYTKLDNTNAEIILTLGSAPPHPALSPAFAEAASRRQAPGERGRVKGANLKEFNASVLVRYPNQEVSYGQIRYTHPACFGA